MHEFKRKKMKTLLKKYYHKLLSNIKEILALREWKKRGYLKTEILALREWKKRGYLEYAPQFVKEKVFIKYGIPNVQWVETGTYLGVTSDFLAKNFSNVYSIEPEKGLYENAVKKFFGRNINFFNDVSETVLPKLLPTLNGDCNFWLDGHYSAGITFKGNKDCPVEDELNAIQDNLGNFKKLTILIDDVRCFLQIDPQYSNYPSINFLVDWARKNDFKWRIEQDIFIM